MTTSCSRSSICWVELGELRDPLGNPSRRRSIQVDSLEDALRMIDRLEKSWPARRGNKLDIAPLPELPKKETNVRCRQPRRISWRRPNPKRRTSPQRNHRRRQNPSRQPPLIRNVRNCSDYSSSLRRNQPRRPLSPMLLRQKSRRLLTRPTETATEKAEEPEAEKPSVPGRDNRNQKPRKLLRNSTPKRLDFSSLSSDYARTARRPPALPGELRFRQRARRSKCESLPTDGSTSNPTTQRALDELEEALAELAPPRKDWKVIQLKYPDTWALGIELILHDVFKEEIEAGEKGGGVGMGPRTSASAPKRRSTPGRAACPAAGR